MTDRLLTAAETAELLGLSPATVLDRFERGDLPGFRLFGRKGGPVRFRESEILAALESWRVNGPSAAKEVAPVPYQSPDPERSLTAAPSPSQEETNMPARQRGFARRRSHSWLAVWRENGSERSRGSFGTRTEALDYANTKAEEAIRRETAIRFGDRLPQPASPIGTVSELVEAFLARHRVDKATTRKLRAQLKHATVAFGDRRLETLQPIELDVWRSTLPARSAHYLFRAFRQTLEYAVAMGLIDVNPTSRIKNTKATVEPRRIHPFESWEQVNAISEELGPRYAAIPTVLVGTGLRPEELFALERRDLDLEQGVLSVERVYSQGVLKDCRKSSRQRRRVPLRQRVIEALQAQPPRLDTPVVFPAARGGYIDGEKFRTATGHLRFEPPESNTAASTTAGTRSRRGASRAASSCSTSPESWARASSRSTRPTGTCCPTARSICAGCSTTMTPRSRQKEERGHDRRRGEGVPRRG